MAARIRAHDWAATPLGPLGTWAQSLRTAVDIMLGSPGPVSVFWGNEHVQLYNDSYASVAADRHPGLLGQPAAQGWPGVYGHVLAPFFDRVFQGAAVVAEDYTVPRAAAAGGDGSFTAAFSPVRTETGGVGGVFHLLTAASETVRAAEAALRDSEERFSGMLGIETAGVAFWGLGGGHPLKQANDAFLRMTGYSREEASRLTSHGLTPPEFHAITREKIGEAERTGILPPYEKQVVRKDGSRLWVLCAGRVLKDELFEFIIDATERHEAEEAMRRSDARMRAFGEASPNVLWTRDAETLRWEYLNPAFEAVYGMSRAAALRGDTLENWIGLVLPEDRAQALSHMQLVREGGRVTVEYRIRRPSDGEVRWLRNTDFPLFDRAGRVRHIAGIAHDVTELRLQQERLSGSEERLRSALEVGGLATWDWNIVTNEIVWSDEHFRLEGYEVGEVTPSYEAWAARIHPDDLAGTEAALRQAMETRQEYVREFRTVHPDGSVHWCSAKGRFFYGGAGEPVRMLGAMIETTARREWEENQKVLVAELQHRGRNLLGVVSSLASKTLGQGGTVEQFEDRLSALSRAQGLLSRGRSDTVELAALVRAELAAHVDAEPPKVTMSGPAVSLNAQQVQTFALALHELATNAVKYGALRNGTGQLAVTWTVEGGPDAAARLVLDWVESGVPVQPGKVARRGYGRELIEEALVYTLRARTRYVLGHDGVRCRVEIPLD